MEKGLLRWSNGGLRVEIAPEAMAISAFRKIWNSDKSLSKEKAIQELSTLYFMYDPRSDYQFETDENERLRIIKEQTGLPQSWQPNQLFKDAIPVIKYYTNCTSAKILESNRANVEKIRLMMDAMNLDSIDEDKKPQVAINMYKAIEASTELAVKIAQAEKDIYKDVEEHSSKLMSKHTNHTVGDLGLKKLFKSQEND